MSCSPESIRTNDLGGLDAASSAAMRLAPLCEGLCALNARVAGEFLALAEVLQSNSMRARQITAESHKATGSEANLQSNHSIALLQRILTDSAGVSDMVVVSTEQIMEILCNVKAARAPLGNLAKMRRLLQTLGLLSRIEGGRITNTAIDLSGLSIDINELALEVQQHVDRILEDSGGLSDVLQKGVQELRRFQQQEQISMADLVRRTQGVLGPMIARSEALQTAGYDIDDQYASFHRSTDNVVMSLQSEDIARQRVEHVHEAVQRVAASLDAGMSVESCAGVLAVQRSQLLGTRDLIANSILKIQSEIESLSPRIKELVSRTAMLAKQTGEDGQASATVIDNELETVSSVFKQCSSSVSAVVSIVNSVLPPVEQMTGRACALEEIEFSIQLISLNATVKTAQLGEEGIGMGVIASKLQSITKESEKDTRIVLDTLAAINQALAKISREEVISEHSLMMAGNSDVVSTELTGLSLSIREVSREVAVGLSQVRELAEGLCSELERGCNLARGASSITELFDEQLRNFDEAFGQFGYTKEMATIADNSNQGEDMSKVYSMESERKLHLEVFGGEAGAAESMSADSQHQESSEFGDDVELF